MLDIAAGGLKGSRILLVDLKGKIDTRTAGDFNLFMDELIGSGSYFLILQAQRLDYISSAGIASIIQLWKRLKYHRGATAIVAPSEEVEMLFSFTGLNRHIPLFKKMDEAANWLTKQMGSKKETIPPTAYKNGRRSETLSSLGNFGTLGQKRAGNHPSNRQTSWQNFSAERQELSLENPNIAESHASPVDAAPGAGGRRRATDSRVGSKTAGRTATHRDHYDHIGSDAPARRADDAGMTANMTADNAANMALESSAGSDSEKWVREIWESSPSKYDTKRSAMATRPKISEAREQAVKADKAAVLKCKNCALPLRIQSSGTYICPGCGHKFIATNDELQPGQL